ncbi:RdRP-domain-containing protein [Thelephora ganbajun]|uniref:RdRP-domain-containing protein n=1 Tax=Thelephora ganbajun TaxID=370292 RepID=A0ACB6ZMG5_THEGA|nr:RdRP-domain-containing protein [Thelephora ganbajun]
MEVFMWGLSYSATKEDVIIEIARILHCDNYLGLWGSIPVNLEVQLHRKKFGIGHGGSGRFTVAVPIVAIRFLEEYGGDRPLSTVRCAGRQVFFKPSNGRPNKNIVDKLRRTPYVDPHAQAEKQKRVAEAEANRIPIRGIEFGWECRDTVFSCEWEKYLDPLGLLGYDEDRREFRIVFGSKSIALRLARVNWASYGIDGPLPVICFNLESAPIFEETVTIPRPDPTQITSWTYQPSPFTRTRISSLDPDHERVVAYASLAVRFICDSRGSLDMFHALCRISPLGTLSDEIYHMEYRQLFSTELMARFDSWLAQLDFEVAFQVEKTVRDSAVDLREILTLRQAVGDLVRSKGVKHTIGILRSFHSALKDTAWDARPNYIRALFLKTTREYVPETKSLADMAFEDTFSCYHVSITPTAMKFSGPFQERSNRVFRKYPDRHSYFIRVTFEEETRLQLRFDREVDGATFVKKRYGTILRETGLKVGGRRYWFLAYSQSSLKEHSVWFMSPFRNEDGVLVDPAFIIDSLGDFDNAPDPKLIYCPGRYGARISQAFTSTDSGVSIPPEEIREVSDIEVTKVQGDPSSGKWNFTDGVGTISAELGKQIWDTIRARRRNARRVRIYPKCFQIRFQGCKGMVSVDYRQSGRELVIRPSMIKFQAPEWSEIEIARAFDRPSSFYLNRPLIMVLECLGVKYKVFKEYQDGAVQQAEDSRRDFERAGRLLESFGLGASFRLSSIMYHLHKLGVPMQKDPFFKHLMDFAINHVLRELKHHARIPIPGYTLVGVADVHGWLQPDEVFACIVNQQTKGLEYLEGDMIITRSPVIHPGDVQIVRAIGQPPPGSPFEKEPLPNAVVFSIKGDRPVPSKTGGGDLDGDVYNIASLIDLPIRRMYTAAAYTEAPKKLLGRKCTMDDVADFVTDYINSDVLGLVAINWLIIADQSEESIFDEDCMTLAQLHSDAVDYPKSSTPVPLEKIPKLKFKARPDWNQPETMNDSKSADYYESQRAIGRLFRAIELPALEIAQRVGRAQRRKLHEDGEEGGDDRLLAQFGRMSLRDDDQVDVAVYSRITEFVDGDVDPDHRARAFSLFDRYTAELKMVCAAHTISYRRDAMLTEEEAVVGTIVARTSQPRHRRDMISKLRDQTNLQVKGVRNELISEEDGFETKLRKAWALWRVTQEERELMGARTLGLIALGVIFDTIREFEEELKGFN